MLLSQRLHAAAWWDLWKWVTHTHTQILRAQTLFVSLERGYFLSRSIFSHFFMHFFFIIFLRLHSPGVLLWSLPLLLTIYANAFATLRWWHMLPIIHFTTHMSSSDSRLTVFWLFWLKPCVDLFRSSSAAVSRTPVKSLKRALMKNVRETQCLGPQVNTVCRRVFCCLYMSPVNFVFYLITVFCSRFFSRMGERGPSF